MLAAADATYLTVAALLFCVSNLTLYSPQHRPGKKEAPVPHAKDIFGLLNALESDAIAVHQNRCAVVRNRNAECMKCAEACTSGCIALCEGELVITPQNCVQCGTCATVCPTCALEVVNPTDAELQKQCLKALQATEGHLVIACAQTREEHRGGYDPQKVVSVTCLGRVEESLLTNMVLEGATQITLLKGACDTCPLQPGIQTAQAVCDTANILFAAWKRSLRVEIADTYPAVVSAPALDSAEPVQHTKEKRSVPDETSTRARVKVMKDGTLPHHIPTRRERILDDLVRMGEPENALINTRLWGTLAIDPNLCTSCQMCATFCPTGAIAKYRAKDGTFGIEHVAGHCVKCRCCTNICNEGALKVLDEVSTTSLVSRSIKRFAMKPRKNPPSKPHAMYNSLKDLLGIEQVYER